MFLQSQFVNQDNWKIYTALTGAGGETLMLATAANQVLQIALQTDSEDESVFLTGGSSVFKDGNQNTVFAEDALGRTSVFKDDSDGLSWLRKLYNFFSAGTNHLGSVGGNSFLYLKKLTTSNGVAYSAGDNIGGKITLVDFVRTNLGTGVLQSIILWSKENQKPNLYIDFWSESPTGTFTDNSPQVISPDDAIHLGRVEIATTDWTSTGTVSLAKATSVGLIVKADTGRNVYMTVQTQTAITYTSTSGMDIKAGILQD